MEIVTEKQAICSRGWNVQIPINVVPGCGCPM